MNNTTYEGRSLEDLRSSLSAVNKKADNIANKAANITGILPLQEGRRFWCVTEINWDDPRLTELKETYFKCINDAANLRDEIGRLEDGDRYEARKKANLFLCTHFDSFEEEAEWLRSHGLNTLTLAEKILMNPNFLEEVES